ncbi:hypothetical protein N0V95_007282 [Ascochyta clinopodiicola]|nr:hypothetical protein N0V95_007282 [Ascochyta clinopodiicola]
MPLHVEQQLADDFAFLAAIEEGAQSVAAVCLEEHVQPAGLTIRFAALDLTLSDEVKTAIQQIADGLASHPIIFDSLVQVEMVFELIVKLHFRRMLARLRSKKWEKPKYLSRQHKKPLWQDFANVIHRVQFLFSKKEIALRGSVEAKLTGLAASYQAFETSDSGSRNEFFLLRDLIKASYQVCKAEDVALFARRLEDSVNKTPTSKVASAIKCLRQIEKIAAHWRIATSLVGLSRMYPSLFHSRLQLAFLTPYKSIPTGIGHETWANSCHVHAEVQLAVYYDLHLQSASFVSETTGSRHAPFQPRYHRPRVIGTSKWLCYLCYLFLRSHRQFIPANTHGRLYDQWTVPDLAEYGDHLCAHYRNIVKSIDEEVVKETNKISAATKEDPSLVRWRAEPMTSRQNLLGVESSV